MTKAPRATALIRMSPAPIDASLHATPDTSHRAEGRRASEAGAGRSWRRAVAPGIVLTAVLTGAVIASGRLPDGVAPWVAAGAGGATLTALVGVWLKCRAVSAPTDVTGQATSSLQIALFGDFVLQLFAIGIALIALFSAGAKFEHLAGLALAFAGAALVFQMSSALSLARELRARAARTSPTGHPSTDRSTAR